MGPVASPLIVAALSARLSGVPWDAKNQAAVTQHQTLRSAASTSTSAQHGTPGFGTKPPGGGA
jgi:hypothetical protein